MKNNQVLFKKYFIIFKDEDEYYKNNIKELTKTNSQLGEKVKNLENI